MMSEIEVSESAEITFKTITQDVFKLTLPLTTTIGEIKVQIFKDKGENFEVDLQKLIYNGKVLEDTQTLGDVKVDEKKYVVVMVSRKKVEQPIVYPSSSPIVPTTPAPIVESTATSVNVPAPVNPILTVTAEQEEAITLLCGMGYEHEQVIKALRAAFWNTDRAVEYLCTGIPETAEPVEQVNAPAEMMETGSGDEEDPLAFLANDPQFAQIAQMIRSNPALLPQIIQQISATNPDLMRAIQENPGNFAQLLGQGQQPVGGEDQPQIQGRQMRIPVTETDHAAIQRLQAMGFSEQLVIEAYFACDKNEELAVNYILSRMDEPTEDAE